MNLDSRSKFICLFASTANKAQFFDNSLSTHVDNEHNGNIEPSNIWNTQEIFLGMSNIDVRYKATTGF